MRTVYLAEEPVIIELVSTRIAGSPAMSLRII